MKPSPILPDEPARLQALRSYSVLDTVAEAAFDRLTRLGARIFHAPIVLVSLVDQDRQWFKSCYGLNASETSRDVSFCAHAILSDAPLIVPDALGDERFYDNPLVTHAPNIRFYAGAPLITPEGARLGTFCVIDTQSRPGLNREESDTLQDFAALVVQELQLRKIAGELAQAELALRISEDRFNAFMAHSPALAFMKDADGRMLYVNRTVERLWGVDAQEWIGKSDDEIWPPAVAAALRENDRSVLAANRPVTVIEEVPDPGGDVHQLLSLRFPFSDAQGNRIIGGMSIDITDRKRLEDELKAVNRALQEQSLRAQEASRLKSEFLANMSHELRTPLNGIIGFSELLVDGKAGSLSERQQRFLNNVLLSSRHLLRLINDLLDLAKIEAGKLEFYPEVVDVGALVADVLNSVHSLGDLKHIHVSSEVDQTAKEMYTDPVRFKQIVYNYVSNAIKFTPEHGSISLRITSESPRLIRLDVEDNGGGIEASDISRLFQDFEQLDIGPAKRYPGTGLGLALVKKLVERQGGSVEVKSVVGEGSTFSALLPRIIIEGNDHRAGPGS